MKAKDVQRGCTYLVKVSGKLQPVCILGPDVHGGWKGTNLNTGRAIHIRTARRLRRPVSDGWTQNDTSE